MAVLRALACPERQVLLMDGGFNHERESGMSECRAGIRNVLGNPYCRAPPVK